MSEPIKMPGVELKAQTEEKTKAFLDHLDALLEASIDLESEIAEAIKEDRRAVTDFVQTAVDACCTVNLILAHVIYKAHVRLPRKPAGQPAAEGQVIAFPMPGSARR